MISVTAIKAARLSNNAREQPQRTLQPLSWRASSPLISTLVLLAVDIIAWGSAAVLVYALRTEIWGPAPYRWVAALAGFVWIGLRANAKLYPGYGLPPVEELRRTVVTTMLAALGHATLLVATGDPTAAFRLFGLVIWLLVLPLARMLRAVAKHFLIKAGFWGRPIVVIGAGEKGERAVAALQENVDLGLVPVAVYTDDEQMQGQYIEGVPVVGCVSNAARRKLPYPVQHALIALSRREIGSAGITAIIHKLSRRYPTLHIFPDLEGLATLWARTLPIGQHLTLEIPHARFNRRDAILKRSFDLAISIPALLLALPLILVAGMLVKVFSPGPAFFTHEREGRGGRRVRMWKIRTMVPDAEERLAAYLQANPVARFEWQRYVKLRNDPRVVPRVGAILRRSSIDELPQLWNVVRGEMSLVGPRLFPRYHVERFEPEFRRLRRQVPPGMTGLWQVSHRSSGDLSLQQRADSYYIHNWSLWLDLWILLRTTRIVVTGAGAH